jgi:uncharacterized protein (TIGR02677 family)
VTSPRASRQAGNPLSVLPRRLARVSDTDALTQQRGNLVPPIDRVRLEALRYSVNEESAQYIAVMRTFTGGLSGLLSDQSAAEVAAALADEGIELDTDTTDARLSYLVEHGNLARSPRETEARSLRDYLLNRARYQLTQRGELVHRQIEELLAYSESAREVSSEMLGGIQAGLAALDGHDDAALEAAEPDMIAREIGTLFAQFERLVHSTREFYTYLTQVLSRFDLDRGEFQAFKTALLDYLQRFVDEISRYMPQIADVLGRLAPRITLLCERANTGQRLVDLQGQAARRSPGLSPQDWHGLHVWFTGEGGRGSDADGVRQLAGEAMRSLLVNLRRIAASSEREQSRYADLVRLARWFDSADDATAHALWASAFGLYPCRHLGFVAAHDGNPVPPTTSWWHAPVAEVPVMLRKQGQRKVTGGTGRREDFAATKAARVAEREHAELRRREAMAELAAHSGDLDRVRLSDEARRVLLDLYARSLVDGHRVERCVELADTRVLLRVRESPGRDSVITSPTGRMCLVGRSLAIEPVEANGLSAAGGGR